MPTREEGVLIGPAGRKVAGTLVIPSTLLPGVLFLHGWGGNQQQYLERARQVAALGCICLTVNLRGHEETAGLRDSVTLEDNFCDVQEAYDLLTSQRFVDRNAVAVVGTSYGGFLAATLTQARRVRWLGLRVPALYEDADWPRAKQALDRTRMAAFRRRAVSPDENRALKACSAYSGDVLIVQSEHDEVVPPQVIGNYRSAFGAARSLTYRVIAGADHGLSLAESQEAYTSLLVNWLTEMVVGSRELGAAAAAHTHLKPAPNRREPRPG